MCSKVLNGHIILTDTSITTILAPEMTYTPKLIIERLNRTLVVATYSHRGLSSEDKLRLFSIKKPNTFPVYYCSEIQPKPPLRLISYIIID